VQVEPIKPTLKAPGSKCLKLPYDELLSSFAFKFDLRRYNEAPCPGCEKNMRELYCAQAVPACGAFQTHLVGRCRLTPA